jgi:hypothetical protein
LCVGMGGVVAHRGVVGGHGQRCVCVGVSCGVCIVFLCVGMGGVVRIVSLWVGMGGVLCIL